MRSGLRAHSYDEGRLHVVEHVMIRTQASAPTLKDKTVVLGRCLHLHLTQERAEACRDRLMALSPAVLADLLQPGVGRQSKARVAKRGV